MCKLKLGSSGIVVWSICKRAQLDDDDRVLTAQISKDTIMAGQKLVEMRNMLVSQ